jgi:peroxiredoxin
LSNQRKICFALVVGLVLTILVWPMRWGMMVHSASQPEVSTKQTQIDRMFKKFGIIKLAGIAPPEDIELEDLDGNTVRVSDLKGKIVLLNFWTTWCFDCKAEMPSMEKLFQRFKGQNFAMVAVNLREPSQRVHDFYETYKLSFTVLLDATGQSGIRYGIRSIPTTFILNQEGGLIGKVLGPRDWNSKQAIILVEHLIKNKDASLL